MKKHENELKEIFNITAKEEKLSKFIIKDNRPVTIQDIRNLINAMYQKYDSYYEVIRTFEKLLEDIEYVSTRKFEQIEKERLNDFYEAMQHAQSNYESIVKRQIPFFIMELITEKCEVFLAELKVPQEDLRYLSRGDILVCARAAEDITVLYNYEVDEYIDDYSFFLEEFNKQLEQKIEKRKSELE